MSVGVTVPLRVWSEQDDRILRLRLARPKANIIDTEMIAALRDALQTHSGRSNLLGVVLDAEGPHFSFGASVEEHLPAHCAAMLADFHGLILRLLEFPAPVLVVVRGQCLGGGLELACAGMKIFASREAIFGQPEIKLGVFAPAASCLLPERIGRAAAEDLLLSGRSVSAEEAHALGLVDVLDEDPEGAAAGWFKQHLSDKSAAAIHHALRAVRLDYAQRVRQNLARLEELYLGDLMSTHDALEGLEAFLGKRRAHWEDR